MHHNVVEVNMIRQPRAVNPLSLVGECLVQCIPKLNPPHAVTADPLPRLIVSNKSLQTCSPQSTHSCAINTSAIFDNFPTSRNPFSSHRSVFAKLEHGQHRSEPTQSDPREQQHRQDHPAHDQQAPTRNPPAISTIDRRPARMVQRQRIHPHRLSPHIPLLHQQPPHSPLHPQRDRQHLQPPRRRHLDALPPPHLLPLRERKLPHRQQRRLDRLRALFPRWLPLLHLLGSVPRILESLARRSRRLPARRSLRHHHRHRGVFSAWHVVHLPMLGSQNQDILDHRKFPQNYSSNISLQHLIKHLQLGPTPPNLHNHNKLTTSPLKKLETAAQIAAAVAIFLVPAFRARKMKPLRGFVFSFMASSAFYPIIIACFQHNYSRMDLEAGATRYAMTVLTYLLAVTTYAVSCFIETCFLPIASWFFGGGGVVVVLGFYI